MTCSRLLAVAAALILPAAAMAETIEGSIDFTGKAPPIEYVPKEEGMMRWKCDVHPWMRGYTGVSKSGLQAIAKDGTFKIDNVPPGKYTIEAWHEKYGAKTQEVTVEAGKPAKVNFKYDGTEKGGA